MTREADPITTEVIRHGLVSAAAQMTIALRRTAFSPLIYDSLDFCTCLYDRNVRLLAQGRSLPSHMGAMSFGIEACVAAVGGEDALEPGDILFSSDGYAIGSHPQDSAMVLPVFHDGELLGYAALRAHLLDIGAKAPYCSDTTDVFQEGMILPGVFLHRRGEPVETIWRIIRANSRMPVPVVGDLNAMIVAVKTGAAALTRLVERYGVDRFYGAVEDILDHGEALMRAFLERIPNGRYVGQGALDDDGLSDDRIPYEVAVEVSDGDVVIDYTGSPPMVAGPMNVPVGRTVCLARVAATTAAVGGTTEPVNEGHFRPIEVRTRPGTLFHATPPAPIYLCGATATQAVDAIYQAFAQAMPESVLAGQGADAVGVISWGNRDDGRMWATATPHMTGQGAGHDGDGGAPLMYITFTGMMNTPAETLEQKSPLLIRSYSLAQDSGGAGKHRGGLGTDVVYEYREDASVTTIIDSRKRPPWGLGGGGEARPNDQLLERPGEPPITFGKHTGASIPNGSRLTVKSAGGGGYGPPEDRDPARVHEDIRDGYISEAQARRDYPHAFS